MTAQRIIEIEGQIIREISREVINETSLDDIASQLITRVPMRLPGLPRNPVRYLNIDPDKKIGIIMIETPPRAHGIKVQHGRGYSRYRVDAQRNEAGNGIGIFNVMLPYQYFVYSFSFSISADRAAIPERFTISESRLYWRATPWRNINDPLTVAAVPNVDGGGGICWGSTQSENTSFAHKIDDLVNNFWTTVFNEDLGHHTPFDTSLTEWERHSDPLEFPNWPYWTANNTVHKTISEIEDEMVVYNSRNGNSNRVASTDTMTLDPAFVAMPELPQSFTLGRAHEYLMGLTEVQRRRMLAAMELIGQNARAEALAALNLEVPPEQQITEEVTATEEVPA